MSDQALGWARPMVRHISTKKHGGSVIDRGPEGTRRVRLEPSRGAPQEWTEWQCPLCGASYQKNLVQCPADHAGLRQVRVSLPFVWLG